MFEALVKSSASWTDNTGKRKTRFCCDSIWPEREKKLDVNVNVCDASLMEHNIMWMRWNDDTESEERGQNKSCSKRFIYLNIKNLRRSKGEKGRSRLAATFAGYYFMAFDSWWIVRRWSRWRLTTDFDRILARDSVRGKDLKFKFSHTTRQVEKLEKLL